MAARILALPLCFASGGDFPSLVVATAVAYPVGQFGRSALRTCTQARPVQALMCAPVVAAGFRSLALWHAHIASTLMMTLANGVVAGEQNVDLLRPSDRHTASHCDFPHTLDTSPHSQDDTRVGWEKRVAHNR